MGGECHGSGLVPPAGYARACYRSETSTLDGTTTGPATYSHRHRHRLDAPPLLGSSLRCRAAPPRHRPALRGAAGLGHHPPAARPATAVHPGDPLPGGDPLRPAVPRRSRDRQALARRRPLHPGHEPSRRPGPAGPTADWLAQIGLPYDASVLRRQGAPLRRPRDRTAHRRQPGEPRPGDRARDPRRDDRPPVESQTSARRRTSSARRIGAGWRRSSIRSCAGAPAFAHKPGKKRCGPSPS